MTTTHSNKVNGHAGPQKLSDALVKARSIVRQNWLKLKMVEGGLGFSFGVTIAHSAEVIHLAKVAGYTAVTMNLEHQRTGIETAADVCCAALNLGISPICIVPSLRSDWCSRVLDVGAQGIIVPRMETAEMAREMVQYTKHRPIGSRPLAQTPQMQYQFADFAATQQAVNETILTMPMIETVRGLENCEEIAAVIGVDALFVGTFDLSDDMGMPGEYDRPEVWAALERICNAAQTHGKYVGLGGMEWRPDLLSKLRSQYSCVSYVLAGRDTTVLLSGMQAQVEAMKKLE